MTEITRAYSLHQIFSVEGWQNAKELIAPEDRVILLQDATYLLHQTLLCQSEQIYGRSLDCLARAITPSVGIEIIDDEQWLELAEHANNILSW